MRNSGHSVYIALVRDETPGSPTYLKIGRSSDPLLRLKNLQQNLPLPIVRAAYVRAGSKIMAARVELELLRKLAEFGTRGEWFRVQWSDAAQRERLFALINAVLLMLLGHADLRTIDLDACWQLAMDDTRPQRRAQLQQRQRDREASRFA